MNTESYHNCAVQLLLLIDCEFIIKDAISPKKMPHILVCSTRIWGYFFKDGLPIDRETKSIIIYILTQTIHYHKQFSSVKCTCAISLLSVRLSSALEEDSAVINNQLFLPSCSTGSWSACEWCYCTKSVGAATGHVTMLVGQILAIKDLMTSIRNAFTGTSNATGLRIY